MSGRNGPPLVGSRRVTGRKIYTLLRRRLNDQIQEGYARRTYIKILGVKARPCNRSNKEAYATGISPKETKHRFLVERRRILGGRSQDILTIYKGMWRVKTSTGGWTSRGGKVHRRKGGKTHGSNLWQESSIKSVHEKKYGGERKPAGRCVPYEKPQQNH